MPEPLAIIITVAVVAVCALAAWRLLAPADGFPVPLLRRRAEEPAPAPAEPQQSMYDRLGASAIRVAVDQFYHRVLGDPLLAPYFTDLSADGLAKLRQHQALMIGQVLGGPKQFELHELAVAHRRMRISHDAYWRTVGHLAAVLSGLEVDKDIVMHLLDALFDVQDLIVTDGPVLVGPQA